MIEIKEKHFESFFEAPFIIRSYKSPYASPFKMDLKKMLSIKNPIFESENDFTYFTLYKNGKIAGRITAHVHKTFNKKFNLNRAYFGFFESIDDQEVANKLFELAENWAKQRGFSSVAGNFNLTAMQEMGIVVSGFENAPYIAQSYTEPYYARLIQNAGYNTTFPMSTFEVNLEKMNPEILLREKQQDIFKDKEYEFIPITAKLFKSIRPEILDVFNKSFENNPFFVPYTIEEFDFQAQDLVYFLDPSIAFLVKHKGVSIAVATNIPDINPFLRDTKSRLTLGTVFYYFKNKFKKNRALCIFGATLPEYQNKGIVGAISYLTMKALKEKGYKKFGITWISETNHASLKKMENLQAKKLHELRIFEKILA